MTPVHGRCQKEMSGFALNFVVFFRVRLLVNSSFGEVESLRPLNTHLNWREKLMMAMNQINPTVRLRRSLYGRYANIQEKRMISNAYFAWLWYS